jgi:hypothetical protein
VKRKSAAETRTAIGGQQEIAVGAPDKPRCEALASRLRALAASIDIPWRMRVARPPVERCPVVFELQCPKEWGKLSRPIAMGSATADRATRPCTTRRRSPRRGGTHNAATASRSTSLAASTKPKESAHIDRSR